ncbi:hipothetical protein, partial [Cardiosporidium cionae]
QAKDETLFSIKEKYGNLTLFPKPQEVLQLVTNGSSIPEDEKNRFYQLYAIALRQFDVEGYKWLMKTVMENDAHHRFVQALVKRDNSMPHCDGGKEPEQGETSANEPAFPGGPIRRTFGFDLAQWITNMLMSVQSAASSSAPGIGNMIMQSILMIKGFIQSIAATIVDIVPPMIPPPVWINRQLIYLWQTTTMPSNADSVLYPVSMPEFVTADFMLQILTIGGSFPAKYAAKVGKTSEAQYRIWFVCRHLRSQQKCHGLSRFILVRHNQEVVSINPQLIVCSASIFPICWMPFASTQTHNNAGLEAASTFPVCFPQCIAILFACPGFWIDDLIGPCGDVSIPPFCSFSLFINQGMIPPQYTSYEQSHPFPNECPKADPRFGKIDIKWHNLFSKEPLTSPVAEAAKEKPPKMPYFPPLGKQIEDYENVGLPIHVEPIPCNCTDLAQNSSKCKLHQGIPRIVLKNATTVLTHYETPSRIKESEERCCNECKNEIKLEKPIDEKKKQKVQVAKLLRKNVEKRQGSKLGHVIPVLVP